MIAAPFLLIAITFALMWVLIVRPQQRRLKEHDATVKALRAGDDVITHAGIYGHLIEVGDEDVVVEVAEGVRLRVVRDAIARRLEEGPGPNAGVQGPGSESNG